MLLLEVKTEVVVSVGLVEEMGTRAQIEAAATGMLVRNPTDEGGVSAPDTILASSLLRIQRAHQESRQCAVLLA